MCREKIEEIVSYAIDCTKGSMNVESMICWQGLSELEGQVFQPLEEEDKIEMRATTAVSVFPLMAEESVLG